MEKISNIKFKESKYNIFQEKDNKIYLLNTLSKAIVEIDKNELEFVQKILKNINVDKKYSKKYMTYKNYLIENGFLIDNDINETEVLKYKYYKAYFNDQYLYITLLPTLNCNFKCKYCFENEKNLKWNNKIVETLKLFSKNNFIKKEKVHISLFGGEPLLEWSKIENFFDYIKNLDIKYNFNFSSSIATNGYLLNENIINKLINDYNCISFQISIDGNKKTHNSTRILKNNNPTYNVVLNNLKKLLLLSNDKVNINLRINLLNNSLEDIEELLDEFSNEEKQIMKIYFRPIYNNDNFCMVNKNRENLEQFYKLAKLKSFKFSKILVSSYYCEGDLGMNNFHINPDLKIWKCMNDMNFKDANIGYIDDNGDLILDNKKLFKWFSKDPFVDNTCINCKFLPLCFGSCPLNYLKNKKRNCFYEKQFDLVDLFLNE